jgi:hypothetical protein
MADTQVLGTCVFGRAGSSPASRTSNFYSLENSLQRINQSLQLSGM